MRSLTLACLILCFGVGVASGEEADNRLACKKEDSAGGMILSSKENSFVIKEIDRGCDSEFTYKKYPGADGGVVIFSWPGSDELGINAWNEVFVAALGEKEAKYIGTIPVMATEISDKVFKTVTQSGSLMYEEMYQVSGYKIVALIPSKEVVIAGELCVYPEKNSVKCKTMKGTLKKPLCVFNYGGRKILSDISECSAMLQGQ
jgi:hypothetical protein